MEKEEILQEIKAAEEKANKIINDAEEEYKKKLIELDQEMESLLEKMKEKLDKELTNELKTETDRILMEKQRAISEGTREIEKIREEALVKNEEAVKFVIDKFMRYLDAIDRKND